MFLSSTAIVVELIVVVVPFTVRLPETVRFEEIVPPEMGRYEAERSGMSAETSARKEGVPALPFGAANTWFAVWDARESAIVPLEVIGEPETEMKLGAVSATLVTVPPPDALIAAVTNAVVATAVVLFPELCVVAVADEPSATVPEKVLFPVIVCVPDSPTKAPMPPIASTVVAVPPAPPVPLP
jgi:hypothetical protein